MTDRQHRASSERGPVEKKVWGATGGAGAGYALAALIVFALDELVYRQSPVPEALSGSLFVLVPVVLTWVGGYAMPHTFRDDPEAMKAVDLDLADRDAREDDPLI